MPTRCVICCHSQQVAIDARLLSGETLRVLGNEYGVRVPDLRHHRDEHVLGQPRRQRAPKTVSSFCQVRKDDGPYALE
jgi:hypothetical protein